jgi:tetratricopeptide (TPR) repeat protein
LQGRADVERGAGRLRGSWSASVPRQQRRHEALHLSRTVSVLGTVATTLAILRQDQKAIALADEIQRAHPNDTIAINVTVPMIRAIAVSAARESRQRPTRLRPLTSLIPLPCMLVPTPAFFYIRGMAYEQAGRYAEAQQDFQKVLDLKSHNGPDLVFAVAQLELGRVFQKQGDTPKARIAYQNFFAAWKDADPDVPLLHEAKAEYAKLQ